MEPRHWIMLALLLSVLCFTIVALTMGWTPFNL
jgi:hypothetical protein